MSRTKQIAKQLLPPILVEVARRLATRAVAGTRPEWEYCPDGWRTVDHRIRGWNADSILRTQLSRWPEFLRLLHGTGPVPIHPLAVSLPGKNYAAHNTLMTYAYVLALAASKKDRISLLDWGGGLGHYYLISKALLPDLDIDYHCRDSPLLCRGGRDLLPEINFHQDDEECFQHSYDLVLASSSLHYWEDWKVVAGRLASVSRPYLYVTRLPIVHRAPSFVVVQRPYHYGYETEYLSWHLNRQEFLTYVCDSGMVLMREFLIQENPIVQGAPEQCESRGFLFVPDAGAQIS